MIRIDNVDYETFSVSSVNFKNLYSNVYISPMRFDFCPICGGLLMRNYVYAIQIAEQRCIKTSGDACKNCEAFFSAKKSFLNKMEKKRVGNSAYTLKHDYDIQYNSVQYATIYEKTKSVFMQVTVCCKEDIRTYTIVYREDDADQKRNIVNINSNIAVMIIEAVRKKEKSILLDGKEFFFVKIRKKQFDDDLTYQAVLKEIDKILLLNSPLPELTSERTLFVYKGHLSCHDDHHVEDYHAQIETVNENHIGFYVEYCRECDKFLMNYYNYKSYLDCCQLFPMRVEMYEKYDGFFQNRAEYSPLSLNGYNVNSDSGFSKEYRQRMLAFIIDHNIMSKQKICNYLELFIKTNGKAPNMKQALMKWEEDKAFVLAYRLKEHPVVKIAKIEKRNSDKHYE